MVRSAQRCKREGGGIAGNGKEIYIVIRREEGWGSGCQGAGSWALFRLFLATAVLRMFRVENTPRKVTPRRGLLLHTADVLQVPQAQHIHAADLLVVGVGLEVPH